MMRFKVAIAQSIPQIPSHAQENDVGLEMTPFERILALLTHRGPLFPFLYQISFFFATQPLRQPYRQGTLCKQKMNFIHYQDFFL